MLRNKKCFKGKQLSITKSLNAKGMQKLTELKSLFGLETFRRLMEKSSRKRKSQGNIRLKRRYCKKIMTLLFGLIFFHIFGVNSCKMIFCYLRILLR